jgi:hypothetical protein
MSGGDKVNASRCADDPQAEMTGCQRHDGKLSNTMRFLDFDTVHMMERTTMLTRRLHTRELFGEPI